jgi:hypothetical protein
MTHKIRCVLTGLLGLSLFASASQLSSDRDELMRKSLHARHDRAERAAGTLDPQNRATAEELYDATMDVHHTLNIPDNIKAVLKSPVVDAELAYWNKATPGIHEINIVKAFNDAVTTLALPNEAKTSRSQLSVIRHGLSTNYNPVFMGKGLYYRDDKTGEVVTNPRMSPLQTLHVVLSLIDAKLLDDRYLVTPKEWDNTDKSQFSNPPPAGSKRKAQPSLGRSEKSQRIEGTFHQAMYKLSGMDGLTLLKNTLSTLGVI